MRGFTHPPPLHPGSGHSQLGPYWHVSPLGPPPALHSLEHDESATQGLGVFWRCCCMPHLGQLGHPPVLRPWPAHLTSLSRFSGLQMGTRILTSPRPPPPPPTLGLLSGVKERTSHSSWSRGGPSSASWPLYFPSPIYETS